MPQRDQFDTADLPVFRQQLVCQSCGGRRDCTLTAAVRYTRCGWPRCCGEVMALTAAPDHETRAIEAGSVAQARA